MSETSAVICLADDDTVLRETLVDILQLEGYTVLEATNGIEALERIREQMPDLILADMTMPRMSGTTLFQEVRSVEAWRDIPFIILTARLPAEAQQVLALGVNAVMTKPFDLDEMLELVQKYLSI